MMSCRAITRGKSVSVASIFGSASGKPPKQHHLALQARALLEHLHLPPRARRSRCYLYTIHFYMCDKPAGGS